MSRIIATVIATVPAAGQLFALQGISPSSVQLREATPTLTGLQYADVGPKHSNIVVKSTTTCLDTPSHMYYFIGGTSNDVKVKDDYFLYGISTDSGVQVSQFKLPTPDSALMLSFVPMEWKLGCDQAGGVFLYGEWDGTDDNPPKQERTLLRYDTKTQTLDSLAQLDAYAYEITQQSFPVITYPPAVDAEDGLVSIVINAYSSDGPVGGLLTLVNTTDGTVRWQQFPALDSPDVCAQVYDPVNKRFFGIATIPTGPTQLYTTWTCWWDAHHQPQPIVQVNDWTDCSSVVSTIDLSARAAIFEIGRTQFDRKLTTVSLDTGEMLTQQGMPEGFYYFQQQQTTSLAPELVV